MGAAYGCVTIEVAQRPPIDADSIKSFDRSTFSQMKAGRLEDHYRLLNKIGSGSHGVVSVGEDRRTKSARAVKTILKSPLKDVERLKQEFEIVTKLDHPNICKAMECFEDHNSIYLVMELMTGETLQASLDSRGAFREGRASGVMRQVFSALAYLHKANLVFRDLKTENIMFRSRESQEVKLIDFGLCCPIAIGEKVNRAAGTPYTVAPELVTLPVSYDQRCDAWSAGVVMYMLLSGELPFKGETSAKLMANIKTEPCSFKDPLWKRISKEAILLLAELMHKKADERMGVSDALAHPWVAKEQQELPGAYVMEEVMDAFLQFQTLNMLQKAALTALAWRARDSETQHLRDIFSALDRDGNGHITLGELADAIESTDVEIPDDLVKRAMEADSNGGGTIEYTEFLAATLDKTDLQEDMIREAFRVFDQDGSGTISKTELLRVLAGAEGDGRGHGNRAVKKLLKEHDASGDAVIDFKEFMDMLTPVRDEACLQERMRARRSDGGEMGRRRSDGRDMGRRETDGGEMGRRKTDGGDMGRRETDGGEMGRRRSDGRDIGRRETDGGEMGRRKTDGGDMGRRETDSQLPRELSRRNGDASLSPSSPGRRKSTGRLSLASTATGGLTPKLAQKQSAARYESEGRSTAPGSPRSAS